MGSLARKLHAVKDDAGVSLLDQSLLFASSEIADGDHHTHTDLPVLVLGRGGGAVVSGRHIRRPDEPMANLFITMLQSVGVPATAFGDDGTGPLDIAGA